MNRSIIDALGLVASCSTKASNNEERSTSFATDPDIKKFDNERVHCRICNKWVIVSSDDQAVKLWGKHRAACQQSSGSATTSTAPKYVVISSKISTSSSFGILVFLLRRSISWPSHLCPPSRGPWACLHPLHPVRQKALKRKTPNHPLQMYPRHRRRGLQRIIRWLQASRTSRADAMPSSVPHSCALTSSSARLSPTACFAVCARSGCNCVRIAATARIPGSSTEASVS